MFTPSDRPDRSVVAAGGQNGADAEPTPFTPTLTHHQQVADQVVAMLDEAIATIPKFQIKHPATTKFVHGHLNIPIPFMEKAIAGVAKKAPLQAFSKLDVAFSLDTIQLNQAFRPVVDKLFNLATNLKYTLDSRLALLGADSLQVYYLAKGLGRDPAGADMLQFAADLKRELNRTGPKKAVKAAPPATPQDDPGTALVPVSLRKKRPAPGEEVYPVTEL